MHPVSDTAPLCTITADVNGTNANVAFAGLAPEIAGLYQFNVQIPESTQGGDQYIGISGPDSYTLTLIPISVGLGVSAPKPGPKAASLRGARPAHGAKKRARFSRRRRILVR